VGDEPDRLLALGDAALTRRDYERAVEHYKAARKKLSNHPAPIVGIVSARFGQHGLPAEFKSAPKDRRVDALIELIDQALRLDPNYAPALIERAQLLLVKGRADDARDVLLRAVELVADDAEAHSALAVVALASGDVHGALEGFSRAAALDPNNPSRLTNLGTTLLMNGDVSAAIGALERSLALAPDDPRTRSDLGTALLASGKPKAALPHLLRAHELAPDRATFMSNLAYAHLQLDQLDLAEQWCKRALEKDAKLGSAWINLGLVRVRLGDNAGAKQAFQRAQALDPSDPRPKANLQELQELMKRAQ
jgi:Flp pilus assembly protein TadD